MFSKPRIRTFLFATAAAGLAACAPVDHGMGEAVKYDMALQTINPQPVYGPNALQPGYSGEKASEATKRYRKDQVNDRFNSGMMSKEGGLSTTETIGSGNGGGGR
jgi:hypothetical protein